MTEPISTTPWAHRRPGSPPAQAQKKPPHVSAGANFPSHTHEVRHSRETAYQRSQSEQERTWSTRSTVSSGARKHQNQQYEQTPTNPRAVSPTPARISTSRGETPARIQVHRLSGEKNPARIQSLTDVTDASPLYRPRERYDACAGTSMCWWKTICPISIPGVSLRWW